MATLALIPRLVRPAWLRTALWDGERRSSVLDVGLQALRSPVETLRQLWDGLLRAVPKKKVSHSRKRMRSAHKGLDPMLNVVRCPTCGAPRLLHHICSNCLKEKRNIVDAPKPASSGEPAAVEL